MLTFLWSSKSSFCPPLRPGSLLCVFSFPWFACICHRILPVLCTSLARHIMPHPCEVLQHSGGFEEHFNKISTRCDLGTRAHALGQKDGLNNVTKPLPLIFLSVLTHITLKLYYTHNWGTLHTHQKYQWCIFKQNIKRRCNQRWKTWRSEGPISLLLGKEMGRRESK